jgi:hypothetical protein
VGFSLNFGALKTFFCKKIFAFRSTIILVRQNRTQTTFLLKFGAVFLCTFFGLSQSCPHLARAKLLLIFCSDEENNAKTEFTLKNKPLFENCDEKSLKAGKSPFSTNTRSMLVHNILEKYRQKLFHFI